MKAHAAKAVLGIPASTRLPARLFRAYDLRGIVGQDLDANAALLIGRAIGSQSKRAGERRVLLARDGRLSSPKLMQALQLGLLISGCKLIDLGLVPVPLLYFAAQRLSIDSAVMLTGSHNPPDHNGFKILRGGEPLTAEQIQQLRACIEQEDFISGQGSLREQSIIEDYSAALLSNIQLAKPLKVVIDCGNGATGVIAPPLFEGLGCQVKTLFAEIDGRFPNHHPDPSRTKNLQSLIQAVKASNADIGLAFDGDGDRLGVVTAQGQIIPADTLLMLLATKRCGAVVFDVKCSHRLPQWITQQGGRPLMVKTGRTHIRQQMQHSGAWLGGELSGHFCFADRWNGFDDALYAAARVLELLSASEKPLAELIADLPQDYSTAEIFIPLAEEEKFALIKRLQQGDFSGGRVNKLDGVRVDYPRGFALIRASNTQAALTLRFAADDKTELSRIQSQFAEALRLIAPDLTF